MVSENHGDIIYTEGFQKQRQLDKKYLAADISTPLKYQYLKPEVRDIEEYISALKEDKQICKS